MSNKQRPMYSLPIKDESFNVNHTNHAVTKKQSLSMEKIWQSIHTLYMVSLTTLSKAKFRTLLTTKAFTPYSLSQVAQKNFDRLNKMLL